MRSRDRPASGRSLEVVQVVVRFHPHVGGVEKTVLELSKRLVRRGHGVAVVCSAEPPGPEEVEGIAVTRLPYRGKIGNTNLCFGVGVALRRLRFDVVHTHIPTALFADAAAAASRRTGAPLVVSYNNDLFGRGVKSVVAALYNRFFLPRVLRTAARVVVGNAHYPWVSPHLAPFRERTVHVPWGVDLRAFAQRAPPDGNPPVLAFLSLLDVHHRYKGLDELLEALRRLRDRGEDFVLRVGGTGEELDRYRSRAAALGLGRRVTFLGYVPQDRISEFFAAADLFVLPSSDPRQEGFGLVLLEAMAVGRPVLTTPVVGMADDIRRCEAGVLVPPKQPDALAAALETCLRDRDRLRAMGQRARRLMEDRYGWETVADRYEALYEEVLGDDGETGSSSK